MRSVPRRRLSFVFTLIPTLAALLAAPRLGAQGGEPQYFAIRGATVVPVSGPRMENATVIVSRGVITAVGKDAAIPEEAWVIDGKGLTVYPGLVDSFTDVGLSPAAPAPCRGWRRRCAPGAADFARAGGSSRLHAVARRGRRSYAHRQARRIVAQRRIYDRRFRAERRNFSRSGRGARSGRRAQWRYGCEDRRWRFRLPSSARAISANFPQFADGRSRIRPPSLAGYRLEHQIRGHLREKSTRRGAAALRPHRLRTRRRAGGSRAGADPGEQLRCKFVARLSWSIAGTSTAQFTAARWATKWPMRSRQKSCRCWSI